MSQPDDDERRVPVTITSGTMVYHYRIIDKIGAGGMGVLVATSRKVANDRMARRSKIARFECPGGRI